MVLVRRDVIFNESDSQYYSCNTDGGTTVCHEEVTIPVDEPIELSNELTTSGTSSSRTPTPVLKETTNSTNQI